MEFRAREQICRRSSRGSERRLKVLGGGASEENVATWVSLVAGMVDVDRGDRRSEICNVPVGTSLSSGEVVSQMVAHTVAIPAKTEQRQIRSRKIPSCIYIIVAIGSFLI